MNCVTFTPNTQPSYCLQLGDDTPMDTPNIIRERLSFTAAFMVIGGTIGGLTVMINHLSRIPFFLEYKLAGFPEAYFVYGSGIATGLVIALPLAYLSHGGPRYPGTTRQHSSIWYWVFAAVTFWIGFTLLLGAFFLPLSLLLLSLQLGIVGMGDIFFATTDIIILAPWNGVASGSPFLFSALFSGLFFGVAAITMDRISVRFVSKSNNVLWITSIIFSIGVTIATFSIPYEALAKLG